MTIQIQSEVTISEVSKSKRITEMMWLFHAIPFCIAHPPRPVATIMPAILNGPPGTNQTFRGSKSQQSSTGAGERAGRAGWVVQCCSVSSVQLNLWK